MSPGLQQRYQISERDIWQHLVAYHGPRVGSLRNVAEIHASSCRDWLIGRDVQNYAVR